MDETYIVHSRHPLRLLRDLGWWGFLGFHVLVGGMILTSILHTMFVGSLLGRLIVEGLAGFVPGDIWDWLSVGVLVMGYGGAVVLVTSGLCRFGALHLLAVQILLPAYWFLHSIAALQAAAHLITQPTYWAKTTHGLTRMVRGRLRRGRTAVMGEGLFRPRIG